MADVEAKRREAARLVHEDGLSAREAAKRVGISRSAAQRAVATYRALGGNASTLPDPAPEAGGPSLPESVPVTAAPLLVDGPGRWLVLGDLHIPYHDRRTVLEAVSEAERTGCTGVLLNGDVLDCYQISTHYREPDKPRFVEEIAKGKQFLEWLRSRLPRARLVYKEGNHDARVRRYIAERTPELFGLEGFDLPGILGLKDRGVEWVGDKRPVHLGRLPVFHGHELQGGGGVNPARWLFLRIVSTGMIGHLHRTSDHNEPGYDGRLHGTWSVGCACDLKPAYNPVNKWNHGYAVVDLTRDSFVVTNRRILPDGRVV